MSGSTNYKQGYNKYPVGKTCTDDYYRKISAQELSNNMQNLEREIEVRQTLLRRLMNIYQQKVGGS